jgi:hypothetical protein
MRVAHFRGMSARALRTMRRRVGGLALCAALRGLLAPPEAAAELSPLYLRAELILSIAAPTATEPRDDVVADVGAGRRSVLAEFLSEPVEDEAYEDGAVATVFLVSGRLGMQDCAVVTIEVARRSPPDERTIVGTGSILTSILPRRETIEPIEITFPLSGPLALPGERIGVSVAVENRCDDLRSPKLLYDALGAASAISFGFGIVPTTTTTTTSTTTTSAILTTTTSTTTTTVPWPSGCLFQPLSGYEQIWCNLDTLVQVLLDESSDAYGGGVTLARLQRRLARARDLVAKAQGGNRTRRHLRQARQQLVLFNKLVQRKQRRGRIEPDVGDDLVDLVGGAARAIDDVR